MCLVKAFWVAWFTITDACLSSSSSLLTWVIFISSSVHQFISDPPMVKAFYVASLRIIEAWVSSRSASSSTLVIFISEALSPGSRSVQSYHGWSGITCPVGVISTSRSYSYDIRLYIITCPVGVISTSRSYSYDIRLYIITCPVGVISTSRSYSYDIRLYRAVSLVLLGWSPPAVVIAMISDCIERYHLSCWGDLHQP